MPWYISVWCDGAFTLFKPCDASRAGDHMSYRIMFIGLFFSLTVAVAPAQEVKTLFDFADGETASFEPGAGKPACTVSDQHATSGTHSLRVPCEPDGYIVRFVNSDWSGYDELHIDAFVEGDIGIKGSLLVGDEAWAQKGRTYWNRHNSSFSLKPGHNVITIGITGLFRGEAGSKGNDLKTPIDPAQIRRFDLGFTFPDGSKGAVYVDNFRLVRDRAPEGVLAYSFGPENHSIMAGFTPITWNTVHGKNGATAGLRRACYNPNRARDDTFPTRLFGTLIDFEDGNTVIIDVPNGTYDAWLVLDDPGYWDWECARFTKRVITANGTIVSTEERPHGVNDHLFRFEAIEPTPSTDLYETFITVMYPQRRFSVEVTNGSIEIGIEAGNRFAQKIAALVVWPQAKSQTAEAWLKDVQTRNRTEFLSRAACIDKPKPEPSAPADALAKGYWLGFPALDADIRLGDAPGPEGKLSRAATGGQLVSFTFAVRPLQDLGVVALASGALKGPAGAIPASQLDCRYVHHGLQRGFSDLSYTIKPDTLRPIADSGLALTKHRTRQFWITVAVPVGTKPGSYAGTITLRAGMTSIAVPLAVEVLDVTLDQPDFVNSYLGFGSPVVYDKAKAKSTRDELFAVIRDGGMNSLTDGPSIGFSGFATDGTPQLDFTALDEFFASARKAGLPMREVLTYGSIGWPTGVANAYETDGSQEETAKTFGKSYAEIIGSVFTAIDKHARTHGWPMISYCRCDEPRVLENAQRLLDNMRLFRDKAPMVRIGGFYSINWASQEPLDLAHQDIFKTLVWSGLNEHHQIDLDQGKTFGREVYIYNQATTRFSFGAYQWAEMRKGVKGRAQWHQSAISGYQFFDLDGREPDTGYLRWSSKGILPTLPYYLTREGIDDFRWAVTLWNRAEQAGAAGADAKTWLQKIADSIPAGAMNAPANWMGDDTFRAECCQRLVTLLKP